MIKPEGNAVVYCEGNFGNPDGKTAHGLVRFTHRYRVCGVIDSLLRGQDAGTVLDGKARGIPVYADVESAIEDCRRRGVPLSFFVIGMAPLGGRFSEKDRANIAKAIKGGLGVDSGLHQYLSEDPEFRDLAASAGVTLRDIRKLPGREDLHTFTGKILEVGSFRLAVLGTDSTSGKRTTSWALVQGLEKMGCSAELIGTGQTAWLQGARYGIRMDALVYDFVGGELEHAMWLAWQENKPQFMVIEGQGSLLNPGYAGGIEMINTGLPDAIVLQYIPSRKTYWDFPQFKIHSLSTYIRAIEAVSGKPVICVTLNSTGLSDAERSVICEEVERSTGIPACDVLSDGPKKLLEAVLRSRDDKAKAAS